MAKPRIFISSTYYDLKYIRSSLDQFIFSLGYESILSEKGDIAYAHNLPLDESCYREIENIDVLILIIGGRYGSEISSNDEKSKNDQFYTRYESITKKEFESAIIKDIPVYILVESGVYSEYRTFLKNSDNNTIKYAHVDSVNIFSFIEDILSQPRNNPIYAFDKFEQIENWLKLQWSGLFKELLSRQSQQSQLKSLSAEIEELQEVNKTLKLYLESLMTGTDKSNSNELIKSEKERLDLQRLRLYADKKTFDEFNKLNENDKNTILNSIDSFEITLEKLKNLHGVKDILFKGKKLAYKILDSGIVFFFNDLESYDLTELKEIHDYYFYQSEELITKLINKFSISEIEKAQVKSGIKKRPLSSMSFSPKINLLSNLYKIKGDDSRRDIVKVLADVARYRNYITHQTKDYMERMRRDGLDYFYKVINRHLEFQSAINYSAEWKM